MHLSIDCIYIFLFPPYICHNNLILQLLDRVEKSAEDRAVAANATVSDHDVEIEHYSNYLKAQMKKIDSSKWMDFTMDTMGLVKRYVCGEKQSTPPPPSPHHHPLRWWMIRRRSCIQHPSTPSQASTWSSQAAARICLANLASIATPSLSQPMYSDFLSPRMARMALMGSPSLPQHMLRPDMGTTSCRTQVNKY